MPRTSRRRRTPVEDAGESRLSEVERNARKTRKQQREAAAAASRDAEERDEEDDKENKEEEKNEDDKKNKEEEGNENEEDDKESKEEEENEENEILMILSKEEEEKKLGTTVRKYRKQGDLILPNDVTLHRPPIEKMPSLPSSRVNTLTPKRARSSLGTRKQGVAEFDENLKQEGGTSEHESETVDLSPDEDKDIWELDPEFVAFQLPIPTANESDYQAIDQKISHPALKPFEKASLPFQTYSTNGDFYSREALSRLSLDPSTVSDVDSIYASYSILNLSARWTFRGVFKDSDMLVVPANLYEQAQMARNANKPFASNTALKDCLLDVLHGKPGGFLTRKVVDITVFGRAHFSKAFLVNLNQTFDSTRLKLKIQDDPAPCILYMNSLPCSGIHDPEKVALVLRYLLNHIDKEINGSGGRHFTSQNLPVVQVKVPSQQEAWSCGYQTLLMRHSMLKAMKDGMKFTFNELTTGFSDFSERFCNYDPRDVLSLRSDLRKLILSLSSLRRRIASHDSDESDGDSLVSTNVEGRAASTAKNVTKRKKKNGERSSNYKSKSSQSTAKSQGGTSSMKSKPKKASKKKAAPAVKPDEEFRPNPVAVRQSEDKKAISFDQEREELKFHIQQLEREKDNMAQQIEELKAEKKKYGGKLVEHTEERKYIRPRQHYDRKLGQAAASMAEIKDVASRRSIFLYSRAAHLASSAFSYADEKLNKLCARPKVLSVIKDPIIQRPDKEGFDVNKVRESPLRLALGKGDKEHLKEMATDILENLDKYSFIDNDRILVDEELFGKDRAPLGQAMRKKRRIQQPVQAKEENQVMLAEANRLFKSPSAMIVKKKQDDDCDWD